MWSSLPNLLTLSRIGVVPLLVALLYVPGPWARWLACLLFTAAALTDYFDGYFARARRQQSKLGRFLDPVADKLLVAATLLVLVALDRIQGWAVLPALVILCRELLISGLREFLANVNVPVPVSRLAKWKTAVQMTAIGILIVGDGAANLAPILAIGEVTLWAAAALALATGYDYVRAGLPHVEGAPAKPKPGKVKLVEPAGHAG